uniref:Odorant receptor n=1 Tax=Streltzoviella insularis TaxID=1206366 RepID=A0A7D5UML5_9NEOP|nr:odorant receptor 10 [Streltzoviella insularis]
MNTLISAKEILAIKHLKIMRIILSLNGAWPGEVLGEKTPLILKCHRLYIPFQALGLFIAQVCYLVKYFKVLNIFSMGHMYITTFLTVLICIRGITVCLKKYRDISRQFLMAFHLIHFKHKSDYHEKIYGIVNKISYYFTIYLLLLTMCGAILFNGSPVYNNYKMGAFTGEKRENITLEFSIYYYFYPGFNAEDYFIVCTIYNFYLSFCTAICVCFLDLYLSVMIFQIIGHIQILKNNIENITKPRTVTGNTNKIDDTEPSYSMPFSAEENGSIHTKLVDIVHHHRLIVNFTDDISNFFGPVLASYNLFHLVSGCLLLFECSRGADAFARYGPLTVILFGQLIQISIIFEIVGYMSEKLIDAIYCMPWESMNISNQRSVCILLHRVQTPIQVTAMGLVPVGVQSMATILKSSLSYFAFLRSMDN